MHVSALWVSGAGGLVSDAVLYTTGAIDRAPRARSKTDEISGGPSIVTPARKCTSRSMLLVGDASEYMGNSSYNIEEMAGMQGGARHVMLTRCHVRGHTRLHLTRTLSIWRQETHYQRHRLSCDPYSCHTHALAHSMRHATRRFHHHATRASRCLLDA